MIRIIKATRVCIGSKICCLVLLWGLFFAGGKALGQAPVISYVTPQTYTVGTEIFKLIPTNIGGSVPANEYGKVTTFAGSVPGDDIGTLSSAKFAFATGLATDDQNNIYIADYENNIIKKISAAGIVTVLAGSGKQGIIDGPGKTAAFFLPVDVVADAFGNVYVAEGSSSLIRKITPDGVVSTFAGSTPGLLDGTGKVAMLNYPTGITISKTGDLYVADRNNNVIRKITPAGVVTTFAGNGTVGNVDAVGAAATFNAPEDLAFDDKGNLYVTDIGQKIRKITPAGVVSTFAGSGEIGASNGTGTSATFNYPIGIVVDHIGNIYVGDSANHLIRKITPAGVVSTLAGNGNNALVNGIGNSASFSSIYALSIDQAGDLYVADAFINSVIRKISITGYSINKPLPTGLVFDTTTGIISGTPTISSLVSSYAITAYNKDGSSTTTVNIAVNDLSKPPIQATAPPNISYTTPQTYKLNATITPLTPANSGGAVPATVYGQVSKVTNGGFGIITSVAPNGAGVVYACDWDSNLIKKVDVATGAVSPFAGNGTTGAVNGPVNAASFNQPDGMVMDTAGNIYIADQTNNMIRKITPDGIVSTLAGNGNIGSTDGAGNVAAFNTPRGLTVDPAGNVYVADQGNNSIRKISPAGVVSTIIGPGGILGQAALLNTPTAVTIDAAGNLYISDSGNSAIKRLTPAGAVSTIATGLNFPRELRLDATGNCYVAEQDGSSVKRISPTGEVTVLAAGGLINRPLGLAFDGISNIYLGNNGGGNVVKICVSGYAIDKALPSGLTFDQTTGIISGAPTVTSPLTDYTITAYNGGGSSTTKVSIEVNNIGAIQDQIITFPPIGPKLICEAPFPAGVISSTSNPITYTSSNPQVASISSTGVITIFGAGNTVISAQQASDASYNAAREQQTLTVSYPEGPDVEVQPSARNACYGTNVTFTAVIKNLADLGKVTYQWSKNEIKIPGATFPQYITSLVSTDILTCEVTSNSVCQTKGQNGVLGAIFAPPAILTVNIGSSLTGPICAGEIIKFTVVANVGGGANNYQWHVNGVDVGTNATEFSSATLSDGDVVTCTVSNSGLVCLVNPLATSDPIKVNIITPLNPPPAVSIAALPNKVYAGTKVTFTATPLHTAGDVTYRWQLNTFNVGTNSPTFIFDKFVDGDKVHCIITNGKCNPPAISDDITVTVLPPIVDPPVDPGNPTNPDPITELLLPTAFTPNGDGVNDQWDITGLSNYKNSSLNVYNRNGELLYHSKGYSVPWSGLYNGKNLPAATYYYVIDLGNSKPPISGYVAIIR